MADSLDRRAFLATTAALPFASACAATPRRPARGNGPGGPIVISSGNGMPAVTEAMKRLRAGADPAVAAVEGVTLVEDDPNDMSVGYGGLPNEDGVVQLDASVMHGPTHKAGAVGALEDIRNPARVALRVLEATDHVMLVGEGAKRFALAQGFTETDMLTEKAREAWMKWKSTLNRGDDWLDPDQQLDLRNAPEGGARVDGAIPFTWGTIHCAALDARGDLGAVTTTSGLSYKIPGRVGDSPIIGAGMFVDNEVGAAGATGRGEACIQSCAAFQVVRHMADGLDPTEACLEVQKWIAAHTKRPDLLREDGRPNFNVALYALRKDGAYGSALMYPGDWFTVHDGRKADRIKCAALFG